MVLATCFGLASPRVFFLWAGRLYFVGFGGCFVVSLDLTTPRRSCCCWGREGGLRVDRVGSCLFYFYFCWYRFSITLGTSKRRRTKGLSDVERQKGVRLFLEQGLRVCLHHVDRLLGDKTSSFGRPIG